MPEQYNALSIDLIPNDDHELIIENIFKDDANKTTCRSFFYIYRNAMGAIFRFDPDLLLLPLLQRVTEYADIIIEDIKYRLKPMDAVKTLNEARRLFSLLLEKELTLFDVAIIEIRDSAKREGKWGRLYMEPKAVDLTSDLPLTYGRLLSGLSSATRDDGVPIALTSIQLIHQNLALFLGVLERAGVEWRSMEFNELITRANMEILVAEWADEKEPWKASQRINAFGWCVGLLSPDVDRSSIFLAAADLRANHPESNVNRGVSKHLSLEDVADEDAARFAFACPGEAKKRGMKFEYGRNAKSFQFKGRRIRLRKFYDREATEEGLFHTLRAMTTALRMSAPDLSDVPTEERDYDRVVEAFSLYYSDLSLVTQVSRLVNLKMLLSRILPEEFSLRSLDEKIKELNDGIEFEDVVVPHLFPKKIRAVAIDQMRVIYKRFCDLSAVQNPYVTPMHFAEMFRDTLVIALMAFDPLRLRSLHTMLVSDLQRTRLNGEEYYAVNIPRERVKTDKSINFTIKGELANMMTSYLDVIRHYISAGQNENDLWVSRTGNTFSRSSFKYRIPKLMALSYGMRVNIHLFRHILATSECMLDIKDSGLKNTKEIRQKFYVDSRVSRSLSKQTVLIDESRRAFQSR